MTHLPTIMQINEVMLEVHFDVDQNGSDLNHKLRRIKQGTPGPEPVDGPYADSLYFAPGEQVSLKVTGHGNISTDIPLERRFVSFQIIDCVIITRPQVIQRGNGLTTQYAVPSPFLQATGACYRLALDFSSSYTDDIPKAERTVTQLWKPTIDVGLTPGMWELSLVMTVRITRGLGSMNELRVLSFDPEAEVGPSIGMRT